MRVEVLIDTTLTVTAGQIIDVKDTEVALLERMGRVSIPKVEEKPKKTKKAKK